MQPAYTVKEFADLFKVTSRTIQNHINAGNIKTVKHFQGRIPYTEAIRIMESGFEPESEFYKRKFLEEQQKREIAERNLQDIKRILEVS